MTKSHTLSCDLPLPMSPLVSIIAGDSLKFPIRCWINSRTRLLVVVHDGYDYITVCQAPPNVIGFNKTIENTCYNSSERSDAGHRIRLVLGVPVKGTSLEKLIDRRAPHIQEKDALWQLLRRSIGKAVERELMKYNISTDAAAVLFTVVRQGREATPASIARELLLEPNSISEQLTRMEKDGLVRKVKDPDKRSRVLVELTDKGCSAFYSSATFRSSRKAMSVLTAEERSTLWALLAKLRDEALEQLSMSGDDIYPPSDPKKLRAHLTNLRQPPSGPAPLQRLRR
jgi:DNA-binding MarR family transcriptional regulator